MNKRICLLATIGIIFVSLLSIYSQKERLDLPLPKTEALNVLGIYPLKQEVKVGEKVTLSVHLFGEREVLSSLALRVVADEVINPLVTVSDTLLRDGWLLHFNKVSFEGEQTLIDLVLIYTKPRGYLFDKEEKIADISLSPQKVGNLRFFLDESQSKVLTKNDQELKLKLGEATLLVE